MEESMQCRGVVFGFPAGESEDRRGGWERTFSGSPREMDGISNSGTGHAVLGRRGMDGWAYGIDAIGVEECK